MKYKTSSVQDQVKKIGWAIIALLSMVAFTTEAKADDPFEIFIDSVSIINGDTVYVVGHLVDEPDGGAGGIEIDISPASPAAFDGYCADCNDDGTFYFFFPWNPALHPCQVWFQATDWSGMYYAAEYFNY
jgi:hypothetical protein